MKRILPIFINLFVTLFFLYLPYYFFQGKLFVGGDDTRLLYAYPIEYLRTMSFFSWTNISSVGYFNPNHFSIPFATVWALLFFIIKSRIVMDYLAFSLPIIIGFIFFKKLIEELIPQSTHIDQFIGALFYVLSPILIINQLSIFLMSAWLIGLIPFLSWSFIRFLRTSLYRYVWMSMIVSIILSLGLYSIPWLAGFILPLCISLFTGLFIYSKSEIVIFLKKGIIFFGFIIFSQAFWVLPFCTTFFIKGGNNLSDLFNIADTFRSTVTQTALGNILYPLLNLPHRALVFDYRWPIKNLFATYYDKIYLLNSIFPLVIFIGIAKYKKFMTIHTKRIFVLSLISFTIVLFFFTVNIGPLKEVFLSFSYLPGFFMFRNFYDKFAPGYVFFYSILFSFSIVIVTKSYPYIKSFLLPLLMVIIVINAMPLKQIINSPLWTTESIYKNVTISQEYLDFIAKMRNITDPTSNVLSLPLNIAGYAIIKEDFSDNVFAGTSPLKMFTGINDFSGELSFSTLESEKMWEYINNRDYGKLNEMLYKYNVGAVLVVKNIPTQVLRSYLFFGGERLKNQDQAMIAAITDKKILVSKNGNYELYSIKKPNSMVQIPEGSFVRVNQTKYRVYIKGLKSQEKLTFLDSPHRGWKIFLEPYSLAFHCNEETIIRNNKIAECNPKDKLFEGDELSYLFRKPISEDSHMFLRNYGNAWLLNSSDIQKHFNKTFYKRNSDGSIDVVLTIYFTPQLSFYVGIFITLISFLVLCCFIFFTGKLSKRRGDKR